MLLLHPQYCHVSATAFLGRGTSEGHFLTCGAWELGVWGQHSGPLTQSLHSRYVCRDPQVVRAVPGM